MKRKPNDVKASRMIMAVFVVLALMAFAPASAQTSKVSSSGVSDPEVQQHIGQLEKQIAENKVKMENLAAKGNSDELIVKIQSETKAMEEKIIVLDPSRKQSEVSQASKTKFKVDEAKYKSMQKDLVVSEREYEAAYASGKYDEATLSQMKANMESKSQAVSRYESQLKTAAQSLRSRSAEITKILEVNQISEAERNSLKSEYSNIQAEIRAIENSSPFIMSEEK